MAILAKDDGTLSIDARPLLSLIDIPVRNMTYTINELVKKGWLELLTDGSYRIDPTVVVSREALLKGDTNNWG